MKFSRKRRGCSRKNEARKRGEGSVESVVFAFASVFAMGSWCSASSPRTGILSRARRPALLPSKASWNRTPNARPSPLRSRRRCAWTCLKRRGSKYARWKPSLPRSLPLDALAPEAGAEVATGIQGRFPRPRIGSHPRDPCESRCKRATGELTRHRASSPACAATARPGRGTAE